jgi:hypothetical protein
VFCAVIHASLDRSRSSYQTLLVAAGQNESAPKPGRSQTSIRQTPQAATLAGLTSRSLPELAIGIARGFIASGIIASGISRHEVDVQKPILQARALDLDMVGELEATLEGPPGDALVEHVAGLLLIVGLLLAADRQPILLRLDREISVGEAPAQNECGRTSSFSGSGRRKPPSGPRFTTATFGRPGCYG